MYLVEENFLQVSQAVPLHYLQCLDIIVVHYLLFAAEGHQEALICRLEYLQTALLLHCCTFLDQRALRRTSLDEDQVPDAVGIPVVEPSSEDVELSWLVRINKRCLNAKRKMITKFSPVVFNMIVS